MSVAPEAGTGGGPPKFTIPKSALSGGKPTSEWKAFRGYLKKLGPNMLQWAPLIWKWGRRYQVPPAMLAALIRFESNGTNSATSSSGAQGLGQIMPFHVGTVLPDGFRLTDLRNPSQNIRFAAWYFRKGYEKTGTWKGAYMKHYNPADSGNVHFLPWLKRANQFLGKHGGAPATGLTPDEQAQGQAQKQINQDPWVVIRNKKLKTVNSLNPPKDAIKMFGMPVTRSTFLQAWRSHYDPIFLSYAGRRAKPGEVAKLLKSGRSDYQLINQLSKKPQFFKSQIWKSRNRQYVSIAQDIFSPEFTPQKNLIRQAIVQNWSGESFAQRLRQLPAYKYSNEFQGRRVEFLSQMGMLTGAFATAQKVPNSERKTEKGLQPFAFGLGSTDGTS